eukprot:3710814-Pyramimonas_sp.AAC.1
MRWCGERGPYTRRYTCCGRDLKILRGGGLTSCMRWCSDRAESRGAQSSACTTDVQHRSRYLPPSHQPTNRIGTNQNMPALRPMRIRQTSFVKDS